MATSVLIEPASVMATEPYVGPTARIEEFLRTAGRRRLSSWSISTSGVALRATGPFRTCAVVSTRHHHHLAAPSALPPSPLRLATLPRAAPVEQLLADLAGIDELQSRVPDANVGVVGFCFGGGMTWNLLDAGEERLARPSRSTVRRPTHRTSPARTPPSSRSMPVRTTA